jgi:glycosyltransferase involved in cell wall biosynthesis
LASAYATCSFTVYPSIMEGFGLPVLESLARGKPCICSAHGALGESARPGGAVALDEVSIPAIQAAIARLLRNPAEISQLSTKARSRTYRSWSQYTSDLLAWMDSLP